jgi:hypothetical protein
MLEAYLTSASSLDVTTYPEQSWIDLSNITHVFTIEGPTEMFGNVFTAMESLIYLHHGAESWCDIKILYNFTFGRKAAWVL